MFSCGYSLAILSCIQQERASVGYWVNSHETWYTNMVKALASIGLCLALNLSITLKLTPIFKYLIGGSYSKISFEHSKMNVEQRLSSISPFC